MILYKQATLWLPKNIAIFQGSSCEIDLEAAAKPLKSRLLPFSQVSCLRYVESVFLFDLVLEILARDQIRDVIIVIVRLSFSTFCLLQRLVALS